MSVRRGTAVTVPQLEARSESSTEALTIGLVITVRPPKNPPIGSFLAWFLLEWLRLVVGET